MQQRSFIGCVALYIVTVWMFRLALKKTEMALIQSFFKLIKPSYIGCTQTLGQRPFFEVCSLPFYNTARCVISVCLILAYFYYKCNCLLVKEIDEAERSFNSNKNVEEDDGDEGKIVTAYSQLN